MRAAVVGVLIGTYILLISLFEPFDFGQAMFYAIAGVAMLASLTVGFGTTTDCLSEEKRENTLGLLFLTDLKGYDVVLGKLAATATHAVYGLLSLIPIIAIPLLAGGVAGAEVARVALVVVANLFFSLALGMFCSACVREERVAIVLALSIMIVFTIGFPVLALWLSDWGQKPERPLLLMPSPGYASVMAFDFNFRNPNHHFFGSVICTAGLATAFLGLAAWILPRSWQESRKGKLSARVAALWTRWLYGGGPSRYKRRTRLLEVNPFLWLASRDRTKVFLVWLLFGLLGLIWVHIAAYEEMTWKDPGLLVLLAVTANTMMKAWIASEASRRLVLDRRSGALELLLATPLSPPIIVRGQLLALARQFAGPCLVVLIMNVAFWASNRGGGRDWTAMWMGWIVVFIADVITISWLGMWMGLKAKNVNRASGATLARVLLLPWLTFLPLWIAGSITRTFVPALSEHQVIYVMIVWALLFDLVFFSIARSRLVPRFRELAGNPSEIPSWISKRKPASL